MSVIGSNILAGASGQGGGYNLTKSLRFRSSANAYLNRTPATATNRQTWTWSGWVKRGTLGSWQIFFGAWDGTGGNDTTRLDLSFEAANTISVTGGVTVFRDSTQVFRDPSAWYHIVVVADTTNATAQNRLRIYVNGVEITNWSTNNTVTQNTTLAVNNNASHVIGARGNSPAQYFDGYLAEVNFIDGQALTPSSFGETSTTTGVWIPKKYTGTYGTNGFYLPFTDTTSTSTLGTDFSGNSNTWTVNNISLTSGSTYDSMTDVPTLTSATTANYSVINPLQNGGLTITNGNLTWAGAGSSAKCATGSIAMPSGKWYFEALITGSSGGNWYAGVCNLSPTLTSAPVSTSTGWGLMTGGGGTVIYKANNNTFTILSTTGVTGSVVSFAIDVDAGKIWFAQNGTWLEGSPSAGTGASYTNLTGTQVPFVAGYDSNDQGSINFGQRPFAYTPPTGFVALNTFNLPTPTIGATASSQANKHFNVVTWTGNGTSSGRSITGVGFQPDFVWGKARSVGYGHGLYDAVRGTGKLLVSNNTNSEATNFLYGYLSSFDSDGFSTTPGSSSNENWNQTNDTYVAWNWKANGTGVTNTAGSITSTVSANTTAGFSIVTWTGSGSTATIGHGLGVTPSMIIWMHRTNAGAYNHGVYHSSLPSAAYALQLSTTLGQSSDNNWWNSTAPTSSVFTVGGYNISDTMVAYCFAPVAGYSAFGSYTGNGSTDGTFVFTGFRPRYVLVKRTDTTANWTIRDTARNPYNSANLGLFPNLSAAEDSTSGRDIDILSNGFKIRGTDSDLNTSSGTYIYMAFAENPFKYANAR